MNATAFAFGVAVFAAGLVMVFAGTRLRGRLVGLAAMGAGALFGLVASDPGSTATWTMAATTVVTLAGLLGFAAALERWASRRGELSAPIDDEPARWD